MVMKVGLAEIFLGHEIKVPGRETENRQPRLAADMEVASISLQLCVAVQPLCPLLCTSKVGVVFCLELNPKPGVLARRSPCRQEKSHPWH